VLGGITVADSFVIFVDDDGAWAVGILSYTYTVSNLRAKRGVIIDGLTR
jgi:hypothetical protein